MMTSNLFTPEKKRPDVLPKNNHGFVLVNFLTVNLFSLFYKKEENTPGSQIIRIIYNIVCSKYDI